MAATRVSLMIFVVVLLGIECADSASHHVHAHAPAPAVDCSSLILNMADCLSFVSNGSTSTKPEGTCCDGLKTVLKADAGCLCEAFKSSAQLGVVLNTTKAMSLPSACKLSAPSVTNCGLTEAPTGAPGMSPGSSPSSGGGGSAVTAPAASPGSSSSGSSALLASAGSLAFGGIALVSFFSF